MDLSSQFEDRKQKLRTKALQSATEAALPYIYALFDLPYPTTNPAATKEKVVRLWSLNSSRPEIRDFKKEWQQESTDRASVECRYEYWNQELEYVRKIARNEGFEAELKSLPLCHESDPELRRMGF
ncbi:hypothetical protein N7528_001603 [Penicillium herquei]|nr:hypothetical protein N7528_001603 [Penicillium herquei]